jgi:hypothetical protein
MCFSMSPQAPLKFEANEREAELILSFSYPHICVPIRSLLHLRWRELRLCSSYQARSSNQIALQARCPGGATRWDPLPRQPGAQSVIGRRLPRPGVWAAELADGPHKSCLPPHLGARATDLPGATGRSCLHNWVRGLPLPRGLGRGPPLPWGGLQCCGGNLCCCIKYLRCFMCCHLMFSPCCGCSRHSGMLLAEIWDVSLLFSSCLGCCRTWYPYVACIMAQKTFDFSTFSWCCKLHFGMLFKEISDAPFDIFECCNRFRGQMLLRWDFLKATLLYDATRGCRTSGR